jgi:hypothetical protein
MSLFNWFSGRSGVAALSASSRRIEPAPAPLRVAHPPAPTSPQAIEASRVRRHARREQLFNAIREAMTRAGVLSARYKFKVLSLDQTGNEFMVMVDLSAEFGGALDQLINLEAAIIRHAKARHDIVVPTVYWRLDGSMVVSKPAPLASSAAQAPGLARTASAPPQGARPAATAPAASPQIQPAAAARPAPPASSPAPLTPRASVSAPTPLGMIGKPPPPITNAEVAAFQQALRAASAKAPAVVQESGNKSLGRPRSYTLLTGFEDTEMPDGGTGPNLSKTQYGDL